MKLGIRMFCAAAVLLAAACADDPKPKPRTPVAATPARVAPRPAPVLRAEPPTTVQIDQRIRERCGLDATYFDFDSANVKRDADGVLEQIADCFSTGPLKGKAMSLVGHADPRGETEYNFALGQRRAGSVGEYLRQKGLDEGQITTTSRGEIDATGSDEKGWARDRRVDVVLDE